jgi:hypothetical protein
MEQKVRAFQSNRRDPQEPWPTPLELDPLVTKVFGNGVAGPTVSHSPHPAPLPAFITSQNQPPSILKSISFSVLRAVAGRSIALATAPQFDKPGLCKTCREPFADAPSPPSLLSPLSWNQSSKVSTLSTASISPPPKREPAIYQPRPRPGPSASSQPDISLEGPETGTGTISSECPSSDLPYDDVDRYRDARNTALMPLNDIVNVAGGSPVSSREDLRKQRKRKRRSLESLG